MSQVLLWLMCLLYIVAGVNHFVNAQWYIKIIPLGIPYPESINYLIGACEIMFALLLIPASTRAVSAWLIIALLVAVFPANIQMSLNYWKSNNPNFYLTLLRLPIQFLLIWWAWQYTVRK